MAHTPQQDSPPAEYELLFIEEEAVIIPTVGPRPAKAHRYEDAAFDLEACSQAVVPPNGRAVVNTSTRIALPSTLAGLVLSRSGLAANYGVKVLNAPGLIDPGYRGEIKVILHNTTADPFFVNPGDRIAQLLVIKPALVQFNPMSREEFEALESDRGEGGFGSTGLSIANAPIVKKSDLPHDTGASFDEDTRRAILPAAVQRGEELIRQKLSAAGDHSELPRHIRLFTDDPALD